jgi:flagellar assembly factor FliW
MGTVTERETKMKIETTRFGAINISETDLITMKGTILGFKHLERFVLLTHDSKTPMGWLQSLEDPAIAFAVINPCIAKADYTPDILEDDLKFLDIRNEDDIALLTIVTVRSEPFRVTANLKAPLLINVANRDACQVVLDDGNDYPIQYDIRDRQTDVNMVSSRESERMSGLNRIALALTTT